MSKQIAKNTFTGGLLMDLHPLSSQNTVLTNALNASLVTIDGDEMILLNDMGNLKVIHTSDNKEEDVTLTPGFIPIGVNTLNGIAYIISYNPNTFEGEIGTFPSPDYPLCTPSGDCCTNPDDDDPVDPVNPDDPVVPDDPVDPDDPTPVDPDSEFPVPKAVDLGLSVKWAKWNMGAKSEYDGGGYYGWGDPTGKMTSTTSSDYATGYDKPSICGTDLDIATVNWGSGWRLPTVDEVRELLDHSRIEHFTAENGVFGYNLTCNGQTIFIPIGGWKRGNLIEHETKPIYWTGDLNDALRPQLFVIDSIVQYRITENRDKSIHEYIRPVYDNRQSLSRNVKKLRALKAESEVLAYDVNSSKEGYELHKNLVNKYQPLYNLYKGCVCDDEGTPISCLKPKQDADINCLLHPLRTTHFNFNLEHPVTVDLQPSYDGSVNIIINDGYNIPRLINSRFLAKEDGTWEVPDRHKNTDNICTVYEGRMKDYEEPMCNCDDENKEIVDGIKDIKCGCYDVSCEQELENQSLFDISTSLSKRISAFPITVYNGVLNTGNLPVGNYTLYYKYCDEDGNETDFIGESGIISIFKGNDRDPFSIDGGERDMDSNKSINVTLKFNDPGYSFIKVYYSRTSAAADENRVSQAFEIIKTYPISDNGECNIIINGDEEKQLIPITDLSQLLTIVNSAETQTQIGNRLFFGNISQQDIFYKHLTKLSLNVVPYVKRIISRNKIGYVDPLTYLDYTKLNSEFKFDYEYYNTKNIYYNVGYWNEEYYRLGIVYIFEDGSLSPVYNILGYNADKSCIIDEEKDDSDTTHISNIKDEGLINSDEIIQLDIDYDEKGFINEKPSFMNKGSDFNAKGVIKIDDDELYIYNKEYLEKDKYLDTENSLNKIDSDSGDSQDIQSGSTTENIANNYIYSIGVYLDKELIKELKNKYCIKGFFITRQKRIPTVLAQGFTMPWDKEAKVPIIEYWGTRHDYGRGVTCNNDEGRHCCGWFYDEIFPVSRGLYLSPYDEETNTHLGIKRRCDIVESFLQQNSHDAFGMSNPKYINSVSTLDDEDWSHESYSRALAVHHIYLQRLHQIFPICIDDEMIHRLNENEASTEGLGTDIIFYKSIRFRITFNNVTWYYRNRNDEELSTSLVPSRLSTKEYNQSAGMRLINQISDNTLGELIINIGEDFIPGLAIPLLTQFYIKSSEVDFNSNITVEYTNNPQAQTVTWTPITSWFSKGYEYLLRYETTNNEGEEIVNRAKLVLWRKLYFPYDSEYENTNHTINREQIEGQLSDLDFESDDEKGHGYSTINAYYTGADVNRLTGEIIEEPIRRNLFVFTAIEDQEDIPIRHIPNYYMNGRLNLDLTSRCEDEDSYYTRTANDRFNGGVNKATQKHFYNLYKYCDKQQLTAICPEFEVRLPFYNQLFTGSAYWVKYTAFLHGILHRSLNNERYYYLDKSSIDRDEWEITKLNNLNDTKLSGRDDYYHYAMADGVWLQEGNYTDNTFRQYKIASVTDNVPIVAIDNTIFKSNVGSEAEAFRFEFINEEHAPKRAFKHVKNNTKDRNLCNTSNHEDFNLIRGHYSPYLGMVCIEHESDSDYYKYSSDLSMYWDNEKGRGYGRNFTIYDSSVKDDFETNALIRIQDSSPYYAISERITFKNISEYDGEVNGFNIDNNDILYDLYRGDCFLYTFTHRLNRNFNDSVAPANDCIINPTTWRDNYRPDDGDSTDEGISKLNKINKGDVNAVKLGSWITVKGRSSYNLSIRSLDERYTSEAATMGRARGFYPLQQASADGGYKIPNSYLINDGFGSTVGEKMYKTLPEAPYYNNYFKDRIIYSDINVQDSYKNGYRTFKTANINDYTKQYGSITKLVDWYGHILCIFEHGVGILPVNERIESGEGIGGPVFIDNNKVLPDVPSMISDKFGSQWKDSIIKTPYAVYGIDASTKKIWRITGSTTLPTLNVISDFKVENFLKEHLPNDDNEHNILIALRNIKSHYNQTKSDVMFTFYMDKENDRFAHIEDKSKFDEEAWSLCLNEITSDQNSGNTGNFVTFYSWIPLESFNLNNKFYSFDREMVRGILSFPEIIPIGTEEPEPKELIDYIGRPVYDINGNLEPDVNYCSDTQYYTKKYSYPNPCITGLNLWEHNNPSVRPLPTHWYGKQHPFEFEFMVIDDPSVLKIYEDLKIISNNAEPESFHFSITGDNYEFTNDIPNIYYRLEATKELYHNLGSHTSYNDDYKKVHPNQLIKSTIFPLYYNRLDMFDLIYDNYQKMTNGYRDYQNLSGTEVYRNPRSRKFELVTHIKNTPIDGQWVRLTELNYKDYFNLELDKDINEYLEDRYVEYYLSKYTGEESSSCDINFTTSTCLPKIKKEKKPKNAFLCDEEYWYYIWVPQSRLRGNSHYKEDKWNILIPTMTFMLKNENRWKNEVPPLILNWIPKDIEKTKISNEDLPNTYDIGQVSTARWTFRKETKLRDKYCKIKVRYSGEELAIISAVLTTFNISYA